MIIEQARVFNVFRRRFEEKTVIVQDGRFAAILDPAEAPKSSVYRASSEQRIDGSAAWLVPGLVDIHMHIESSMTIPKEFSRAVLPHGTCTVVADPHEIANVFGVEGIQAFMDCDTELDIFYGLPSSVPSTNPSLETTGGKIGPDEIRKLARDERLICLGEVMNAAELVATEDTRTKSLLRAFRSVKAQAPIEGHCPKISGTELAAFIASGVWADHTHQTPESILEKIGQGMFIELQRKSLTAENIRAVVENSLYEHVCLVTDDVMPDQLEQGHLNLLLALAIKLGMKAEDAIYCATYVPARHMGLRDRGAIAPGRIADFILLDSLEDFHVKAVYKKGRLVQKGRPESKQTFPAHFYRSIRRKPLSESDFLVKIPEHALLYGESDCNVICIEPKSTFTSHKRIRVRSRNGIAEWQEAGLSLIVAIERYGAEAPLRPGFVSGILKKPGAIATSWAHDHHNILAAGNSIPDLVLAVNTLIQQQGGYIVTGNGTVLANAKLAVGGIVSDEPWEELAQEIAAVRSAMRSLGYEHTNEIMSFSTLSLLVSPQLKIADKGLVDVKSQTLVETFTKPTI